MDRTVHELKGLSDILEEAEAELPGERLSRIEEMAQMQKLRHLRHHAEGLQAHALGSQSISFM